ncbi:hypothetical protein PUN28_002927 [Cardiocondyla obscurior]|uniref:SH2 domain-containing protein n=1 Tax=Cardiocondyla obscurior TaxID=286306 RepID=A0AAW2GWU1_9HYME
MLQSVPRVPFLYTKSVYMLRYLEKDKSFEINCFRCNEQLLRLAISLREGIYLLRTSDENERKTREERKKERERERAMSSRGAYFFAFQSNFVKRWWKLARERRTTFPLFKRIASFRTVERIERLPHYYNYCAKRKRARTNFSAH